MIRSSIVPFLFMLAITILIGCDQDKDLTPDDLVTPHDFLSNEKYTSTIIEISYVEGYQPTVKAVNNLVGFLEERLNKPGGISVTQKVISSPGKTVLTIQQIRDLEKASRQQMTNGTSITAFLLFVDAEYAANQGDSKVLGAAYDQTSIVVFGKTVSDHSGELGQPSPANLETIVLLHEFGHLLGLVNNGTPLQSNHQDVAHSAHCSSDNCLMYYQAETSDAVGNLLGNGLPGLDAACLADLKANGGR